MTDAPKRIWSFDETHHVETNPHNKFADEYHRADLSADLVRAALYETRGRTWSGVEALISDPEAIAAIVARVTEGKSDNAGITAGDIADIKDDLDRLSKTDGDILCRAALAAIVQFEGRVAELEAENRELALEVISANGRAFDAYDAQKDAEEKLAKAEEFSKLADDNLTNLQPKIANGLVHKDWIPVFDGYIDPVIEAARANLAKIQDD